MRDRVRGVIVAAVLVLGSAGAVRADALGTYLAEVRQVNPEIRAAGKAAEGSEAAAKGSLGLEDPTVGITYMNVPPDGNFQNAMEQWWTVSQALPFPTTWILRGSVNGQIARAARAQSDMAVERVFEMARMAYAEYAGAEGKRVILLHHRAVVQELSRVARRRYEAGLASQADYLKAQMELTRTENELAQSTQERNAALAALNSLRNQPSDAPFEISASSAISVVPAGSPEAWQQTAQSSRPEITAQTAMAVQKRMEERMELSDYWPTLMTSYARRTTLATGAVAQDYMFSVNVPLWFWTKENFQLVRASRDAESAEAMVAMVRNQTRQDVAAAYARAVSHGRTAGILTHVLAAQSRQLWQVALREYEGGSGSFLMVLEAERELKHIQMEAAMERAEWLKAHAALLRVSGKGREIQ